MKRTIPLPTSEEVDRRLRIASELRDLCLSLGRAGREARASQAAVPLPTENKEEGSPRATAKE